MAEFQRKTIPFLHRGMNWNAPPDKIPEGQLPWAKNARVFAQGTVTSRHGHTQAFTGLGDRYIHSLSRLNIANPAFDPALAVTYVIGADREVHVFQDSATLDPSNHLNPVTTPLGQFNVFSGNPVSVVDVQPAGAAVAWKYIADAEQMVTVGYYPSDRKGTNMARCLTVGLTPPVVTGGAIRAGAGNLNGDYNWMFAYRRVPTGARSNPSAATRDTLAHPALTLTNQQVTMTLPVAPVDPQTNAPDLNVVVDVYRFGGNIFRWALVGSGPGGSVFNDNVPDIQLLAAPSPPQATDASTGLTRFNLFRPFVTQDIAHSGALVAHQLPGQSWLLETTGLPNFNVNWLPGSTFFAGDTAFTIYEVRGPNLLELFEDASGSLTPEGAYNWHIPAGTLTAGQPLPHLWGVYGVGQSASHLFACGDPNGPGTLYWTNGNDPDSTDIVNNLQAVSPSEKLQTGCIYDGQPFCWSIERQLQIFPSLTVFGQFTVQEVAGAKGCWLEWSLSVQSNGLADQSVTWRGKDGLYDWSVGAGLRRLTDDLYPFFPHDNNPGIAPETIMPFIGANSAHPENVGNLDDTQLKYHRTCWFQGMLFYDFVALTQAGGPPVNTFSTLVWDDVECKGWVSLDQPFDTTLQPVARGIEIGDNNLLVSWGGTIYHYYGFIRGFETRIVTRAEDMGDPRATKLFGDYWFDCTPYAHLDIVPLVNFHRSSLTANTVPLSGSRLEAILDFTDFVANGGIGFLNQTLGLDVRWIANDGQFAAALNQWQPSFIPKPESIVFRISDRTDEGVIGAKYLMGMNLEANTFGAGFDLDILIDGVTIATLAVNHDGQSELPYAWTPVAGYEFQVEMRFPQVVEWQLFKIRWIFEPWPDAVTRTYPFQNLGTSGAKYIRGVVLPMETGGQLGGVGLFADDNQPLREFNGLSTLPLVKSGQVLELYAPFLAHEIQFSTLSAIRIWPDEAKVDFDPWPELSTERSSFTDLGYNGAKFVQGAVIPLDTDGEPVTLQVNYDGGLAILGPVTTPAGKKTPMAFSFSPCNAFPSDPFVAHEIQVQPLDNARVWFDEIRWVWEPMPELVYTWDTQPTNHDLPGWHHLRECYIAYMGGSGAPILSITTEYDILHYALDPVVGNQYVRSYRVLDSQKAKWRSYRVESCGGLRLFMKDCAVQVKGWGETGAYKSMMPFGDLSRSNGGARI